MKASLFPSDPPSSLTDAHEIIRHDWTAFNRLDTLVNHWERPAWPDGAQAYYWLISLGGILELRERAKDCQKALACVPDLDPVPADLLHLTLCRIGAVADLEDGRLLDIADAAAKRTAGFKPLRLSIGPLSGSTGAIRFSVTPWSVLLPLQAELVTAKNEVLRSAASNGMRPHVSVAYNARKRPAVEVVECVRVLRAMPPVEVIVAGIDLVRLVREGRVYRWTTLSRLTLAENPIPT